MRRMDFNVLAPYGVALVVCSIFYGVALQIAPADEGRLGADVWPKTVLLLAIVTCIWEIARNVLFGMSSERKQSLLDAAKAASPMASHVNIDDDGQVTAFTPWIGIALTTAYVFAFPWLGYPLATFLFVTAFIFAGNYRRFVPAVFSGLAACLGFMFLFMRVVYVSLPIGTEPFSEVSTLLMHLMGIK